MIAMAVARLQVGALRRISASSGGLGSATRRDGAPCASRGRVRPRAGRPARICRTGSRASLTREAGGGGNRVLEWLREPSARLWNAEYSQGWATEIAKLRDAPALRSSESGRRRADPGSPRSFSSPLAIPNIRNSFERADRLALDAELTGKILGLKKARHAHGAWPQPSPEIAASRFPGLSWNYRPAGNAATIALERDVTNPFPKNSLVLPLSFTATAPAP